MTINFYTMCNILFDLEIERFNFPKKAIFNSVSSIGIRVFGLELIKTFYRDNKKLINIFINNDCFLNIGFEDEENIKYFKQSTIEVDKEHLLSLLFRGECVNI